MRNLLSALPLLVLGACAGVAPDSIVAAPVPALRETAPMTGAGDRADDPALWVDPADASHSLILGTNKDEGLYVYDLAGAELQRLPVGRVNNVDLRDNLVVASNDEHNALSWFAIDPATRKVSHVANSPTNKVEPYGVCSGKIAGVYKAIATYKDGTVQIWTLGASAGVAPTLERVVQMASKLEGCVVDDLNRRLFVGEEEHGLWSLDLGDAQSRPVSVDTIAKARGLVADVEGVSLWEGEGGAGYVIVSAQSRDRFVIYDRKPPHAVVGVIHIAASKDGAVDMVTHTDGVLASSAPLPGLPRGVIIAQDDANPEREVNQNFKIVDWREVEQALGLPR